MTTRQLSMMAVALSVMFYFQHFLFDYFKYTKEKKKSEKENTREN
jgi:hypothetical protein